MAAQQKVVVITGAASGIGRATALGFGRQGARVALGDLNTVGLADVATNVQRAGSETRLVALDVADAAQARSAIDGVVQAWGKLDVLVNAAGINVSGPTSHGSALDMTEQDWDRMLDVNLLGSAYCAQAAARHMMRQRQGRIINIASIAGAVPRWHEAAYGVSKASVRMLTKCLALELGGYGITVNAIAPGPTDTPMLQVATDDDMQMRERMIAGIAERFRLGIPLGKLGQPEDVASAILYLASDEAHHITGVILNVDGMAQLS
jgi:NAD(P)-dependent dehydrogenase (short-subunit alcohol dehydrogenase family)